MKPEPRQDRPATIQEFLELGSRIRVIAHRGFSGHAPENTMVAFDQAVEIGADMIELDVLLTRDGHVICIHDDTLERTTDGKGYVADFDLSDLQKLDAGSWFGRRYKGEPLPLLADVLDRMKDKILVNVEIKTEAVTHETKGSISEKVIQLVKKRGMEDQVIISSFDSRALVQAHEVDPGIPTAMLYNKNSQEGKTPSQIIRETHAYGYNLSKDQVTAEIVSECHSLGKAVSVYTVNDVNTVNKMIRLGVNAVFTDHPDMMLLMLEYDESRERSSGTR